MVTVLWKSEHEVTIRLQKEGEESKSHPIFGQEDFVNRLDGQLFL